MLKALVYNRACTHKALQVPVLCCSFCEPGSEGAYVLRMPLS